MAPNSLTSAIAEEMKALFPQYFATYPIVVKLAKGDLLSKLSQPGAQELLKEGLEYIGWKSRFDKFRIAPGV